MSTKRKYPENRVTIDRMMTLEEVGEELGVSKETVRRVEVAAIKKARKILAKRGFTAKDFFEEYA